MTKRKDFSGWVGVSLLALLSVGIPMFLGAGCGANDNNMGGVIDNTPCSCVVGNKRCLGDQIQVCEATSPTCPEWGPATACPASSCTNNSCGTNCTDTCAGGSTRCASDTAQEICRIGPSGCLEWVQQACTGTQYCGASTCQAAIPCDPACPSGYQCKPTGVCAGGTPSGLILDVKTVQISGKVTLNGAAPLLGPNCAAAPNSETAVIEFTDTAKGYVTALNTLCKSDTFAFSGQLYPGTYSVRVNNRYGTNYSNIPSAPINQQSFVANPALVVTAATSTLALDVKTVQIGGNVTLNGAAPTLGPNCPAAPNSETAVLEFVETTKGYVANFTTLCKSSTFAFSGQLYPGTYSVRVNNRYGTNYSNIPSAPINQQSFVVNPALVVAAATSTLAFDVKTVPIGGNVTLNGTAPTLGPNCPAAPNSETAVLEFVETTKGYVANFTTLCKSDTFAFSGQLYPGTYSVRINNRYGANYSNLPSAPINQQSFMANAALVVSTATSTLAFDVKTVPIGGNVTLNGAAPTLGPNCAAAPNSETAVIEFVEATKGYVAALNTLCKSDTFAFSGQLYPGTYSVRINNRYGTNYSNIPSAPINQQSFMANPALVVATANSTLVLDVKTVQIGGNVTLNGAAPARGPNCVAAPNSETSVIEFVENTKGYVTALNTLCKSDTFAFSGQLYPGTYSVRVNNRYGINYSNIPSAPINQQSFVTNPALVVSTANSALALDVKTVQIGGSVTLNGAAPMLGPNCAAAPNSETTVIEFVDPTRKYVAAFNTLCKSDTFAFSGQLYPGTYSIRVNNRYGANYSNIPSAAVNQQSFVAVTRIEIP